MQKAKAVPEYVFPVCFFLLLFLVGVIKSFIKDVELREFNSRIEEYISIPSYNFSTETEGYIIGKIITIDKKRRKIDHIYFDIPEQLRAKKPEEVETIIWLKWEKKIVGSYSDNNQWC